MRNGESERTMFTAVWRDASEEHEMNLIDLRSSSLETKIKVEKEKAREEDLLNDKFLEE